MIKAGASAYPKVVYATNFSLLSYDSAMELLDSEQGMFMLILNIGSKRWTA